MLMLAVRELLQILDIVGVYSRQGVLPVLSTDDKR